jgi:hypothetical protein
MKRWGKKKTYPLGTGPLSIELRSGYELQIAADLFNAGVPFEYEAKKYPIGRKLVGAKCADCGSKNVGKMGRYTPDFTIQIPGSKLRCIVEAKGRMTSKDRKTILEFSKVALSHDALYFVLIQRDNYLAPGSKTRYSDWLKKNGITYAVGTVVPPEWYRSAP